MIRFALLPTIGLVASAFTAVAQNVPPTVSSPIANFTEYADAPARTIDLATVFSDPDVSNAVRMTTVLGNIDIALFGQQKPVTVANFLKYVDQGRYFLLDPTTNQTASSFIHRSESGFVIQGGGFIGTVNSTNTAIQPTAVATPFPPIQNEPGIPNKRGTIAMAKVGGNPNSATSQWFINLADNASLDNPANNGGFTVFGRVVNGGMTVVDSIAALPRYNFSAAGPDFGQLPLRNYDGASAVKVQNLVSIPGLSQISPLSFSAVADNGNVVVGISGTKLSVAGKIVGTSHVTVTATDFDGATVSQTFTVTVITPPGRLVNISTRMQVGTGDNALFAGFIMSGSGSKRLVIRAIGPSSGLSGAVADPVLELHDNSTATIATNDNWGDAPNKQEIIDLGLAPGSPNESVILTTIPSDPKGIAYTAIMRGAGNTGGLGVVEVYDLDSGPGSTLVNISTRGQVGSDPNALIGGFIFGGTDSKQVLVRAIGPSLTGFGVPGALSNPTLDFVNAQGTTIDSNDDWTTSPQKTQIQNSGLAPTNSKESAIIQTIPAGNYTAVVHGVGGVTGVGSVEVYQLP
jgi:cyclophilin family peptidyl-prolyl cis-trans isomerase